MVQTNLLHQVSVATDMQKTCDENKATMLTIEDTIHKRMDAVEGQVDTALELLTPAQLPEVPSPSQASAGSRPFLDSVMSMPQEKGEGSKKTVIDHTETMVLPAVTKTTDVTWGFVLPPRPIQATSPVLSGLFVALPDGRTSCGWKEEEEKQTNLLMAMVMLGIVMMVTMVMMVMMVMVPVGDPRLRQGQEQGRKRGLQNGD